MDVLELFDEHFFAHRIRCLSFLQFLKLLHEIFAPILSLFTLLVLLLDLSIISLPITELLQRTEFSISLVLILQLQQVKGSTVHADSGKSELAHPLSLCIGAELHMIVLTKDWLEFVLGSVENIAIIKTFASFESTKNDNLSGTYCSYSGVRPLNNAA